MRDAASDVCDVSADTDTSIALRDQLDDDPGSLVLTHNACDGIREAHDQTTYDLVSVRTRENDLSYSEPYTRRRVSRRDAAALGPPTRWHLDEQNIHARPDPLAVDTDHRFREPRQPERFTITKVRACDAHREMRHAWSVRTTCPSR